MNNKSYKTKGERSRNNSISKSKNNNKKTTDPKLNLSQEKLRILKGKQSLIKYRKGRGPTVKLNNQKLNEEEAHEKKRPIGNSILLESSVKGYLHDLYNNYIIQNLPMHQKTIFTFEREDVGKFFFNMTNLDFEVLKNIESALLNTNILEDKKVEITVSSEYNNNNLNKETLKHENNENTDIMEEDESDILIKRNQLNIIESSCIPINVNNLWIKHNDIETNKSIYFNPYLQQCLWELPLGANLESNINTEIDVNIKEKSNTEILNEKNKESNNEYLKKPARQQISPDEKKETSYIEGNYDYNIWYNKYLSEGRKEDKSLIISNYKLNVKIDSGYTKADLTNIKDGSYFCIFYAKGCCSLGVNCKYYHRIPTLEECKLIENMKDIFGRPRHATHRLDMSGVGTFTQDCKTLYLTNMKLIFGNKKLLIPKTNKSFNENNNYIKEIMKLIYKNFNEFGVIEDIHIVESKQCAFLKFAHRCMAEFAKEAMTNQCLIGNEAVVIKWANEEPDTQKKNQRLKEDENKIINSYNIIKKNECLLNNKNINNQNSVNNTNINYSYGYGYNNLKNNNIKLNNSIMGNYPFISNNNISNNNIGYLNNSDKTKYLSTINQINDINKIINSDDN